MFWNFLEFLKKNRVRWNFNTVFGFKKTVLDRIPGYKRNMLKEECLYMYSWLTERHVNMFTKTVSD